MTTQSVQVKIELGHKAIYREYPTAEGFTHDWEVFVKGPEGNIQHFVEKVVFHLHESFSKPKRVIKEPPYKVTESGYAGFALPIEIYFKNKEEPKKINFNYDLFLNSPGCPDINHIRCEKLTFQNPTQDFRRKLIKAGGTGIPGQSEHPTAASNNASPNNSKKSPNGPSPSKKQSQPSEFSDLFGQPIKVESHSKNKVKPHNDQKHSLSNHEEQSKDKAGSLKTIIKRPPIITSDSKQRDHSSKSVHRDKSHKKSKKEKKEKRHSNHEHSSKGRKSTDSSSSNRKSSSKSSSHAITTNHESGGHKSSLISEQPAVKKHVKNDTHKMSLSRVSSNSDQEEEVEDKTLKSPLNNKSPITAKSGLNSLLAEIESDITEELGDLLSPLESDSPSQLFQSVQQLSPIPSPPVHRTSHKSMPTGHNDEPNTKRKTSSPIKGSSVSDKNQANQSKNNTSPKENSMHNSSSSKHKSSHHSKSKDRYGSHKKDHKHSKSSSKGYASNTKQEIDRKELEIPANSSVPSKLPNTASDLPYNNNEAVKDEKKENSRKADNGEKISVLLDLQKRLMTTEDMDVLQKVADVIEETGKYSVSSRTLDFDLCSLDMKTLRKLTNFLEGSQHQKES